MPVQLNLSDELTPARMIEITHRLAREYRSLISSTLSDAIDNEGEYDLESLLYDLQRAKRFSDRFEFLNDLVENDLRPFSLTVWPELDPSAKAMIGKFIQMVEQEVAFWLL